MSDGDLIVALQIESNAWRARAEDAESRLAELDACVTRLQDGLDALYEPRGPGRADQTPKQIVANMMARLAEMAPVVEAAERAVATFKAQRHVFRFSYERDLIATVDTMRAARSLRGAGEGGGA